jgi:hypothetical protein
MEGARACAVQRSRRGKRSVYAAKGPCDRARGATVRTSGGRRTAGRSCRCDEGSGPCANACGPSHAPAWARRPATNFRRKSSLHGAQLLHTVQPSWQSIVGELCLPCACAPHGPRSASAGRQHDRQSNELSPGYWMFRWRRRKLPSDSTVSARATREPSPGWTTLACRGIG